MTYNSWNSQISMNEIQYSIIVKCQQITIEKDVRIDSKDLVRQDMMAGRGKIKLMVFMAC